MPVAELGVIAVTRAMVGAGAMLLLADRLTERRRKSIGLPLLLLGAISTVPLMMDIVRRSGCKPLDDSQSEPKAIN